MTIEDEIFTEYCTICERETLHRIVDDDIYFEDAIECMVCHTVWEAENNDD